MNTKTLRKRISIVSLFVLLLSSCGGPNPTLDDLTFGDELSKEESNEILNECLTNTKNNSSEYKINYSHFYGLYNPKNQTIKYDATYRRYKNDCYYSNTNKYDAIYNQGILKERTVTKEGGEIIYNNVNMAKHLRINCEPDYFAISRGSSDKLKEILITNYFYDFRSYSDGFFDNFTGYRNGDGYAFVYKTHNEEQKSYMFYEGGARKNGTGTSITKSQSIYYCDKNKRITDYVSLEIRTVDYDEENHKKFDFFVDDLRYETTIRVKYDELKESCDYDYLFKDMTNDDIAITSFGESADQYFTNSVGGNGTGTYSDVKFINKSSSYKSAKNLHVVSTLELTKEHEHGSGYYSYIMLNPTIFAKGYLLPSSYSPDVYSYSSSYVPTESISAKNGVTFNKTSNGNYSYYYIPIGNYSTLIVEYDMISNGTNINFQNVRLRLE